ncbi:MAG TPA: ribosome silencing factor [Thermoanaerobaculia bacterium]|nr:ribosome silencing factor [Thermoanaerobaculia bacterium]
MTSRLTAEELAREGIAAALDKKASDLLVLNLAEISSFADYFVICSASSERQAQAIADAVEEKLRTRGRRPISVEGYAASRWILLDYGEVLFHVFLEESRRFYALERLWGDAGDETRRFAAAR